MPTTPPAVGHRSASLLRCALLAACTLSMQGGQALAQGSSSADAANMQRAIDHVARVEQYETAISTLQSAHGPFDTRLLEPLQGLIGTHIENANFDAAFTLLDQQLQIQRINHGLYAAEQIPIIETMLELQSRAGDWPRINDTLHYLSWLYQRDESLPLEARLAGLKNIGAWHLRALEQDERVREAHHLVRLGILEDRAATLAEEHFGEHSEALVPYLYDKAVAELYIALAIMLTDDTSQDLMLQTEGIRARGSLGSASTAGGLGVAEVEALYGSRASTVIERSFKANMGASYAELERIREIFAAADNQEAQAMALLSMGDSVLMRQQFENRPGNFAGVRRGTSSAGSAMMSYDEAMVLLETAGIEQSLVDALTRCPVMLPITVFHATVAVATPQCLHTAEPVSYTLPDYSLISTLIPGLEGDNDSPDGTLEALLRFNVRTNGQVSNVEVITISSDNTPNRVKLRKLTELMQFRPAMRDGTPVRAENVQLKVRIPAAQE